MPKIRQNAFGGWATQTPRRNGGLHLGEILHEIWYLTVRKVIKFVATRRQILGLKCTKFNFGWGSAPDPAGGACTAPQNPIAEFNGPTSKGRERKGEGKGKERGEIRREARGKGGKGKKW